MSITQFIREHDVQAIHNYLSSMSGYEIAVMCSQKNLEELKLIFICLSPKLAVDTFDYLPLRTQKNLLRMLPTVQVAAMLAEMPPDDRTQLLEELPKKVVDEYLNLLPQAERIVSEKLLKYPEDSLGRLMTTDYLTVRMNWTVAQALDHIRLYGHDSETIDVIYVVDDHNILLDDIPIKEFLFVPREFTVAQIADNKFIALSVDATAEQVINVFKEHNRVALPVINAAGELLGIVTIDDVFRLASERTTAKMQKVGGMEALDEPYMETPFFELMKKRARWLVLLFLGEMFTATAMGYFEVEISKAVVLALFLPLIISSGGNAGSQSSTLIIRAMALGEIKLRDWWRIMRREIPSGIFLGLVLGLVGLARVTIWSLFSNIYGDHWFMIALTIFTALIGVVLWGSLTGSMLPFILRRLGADPATSSAPLVATLVDVVGIVIYFTIALVILKGTLL